MQHQKARRSRTASQPQRTGQMICRKVTRLGDGESQVAPAPNARRDLCRASRAAACSRRRSLGLVFQGTFGAVEALYSGVQVPTGKRGLETKFSVSGGGRGVINQLSCNIVRTCTPYRLESSVFVTDVRWQSAIRACGRGTKHERPLRPRPAPSHAKTSPRPPRAQAASLFPSLPLSRPRAAPRFFHGSALVHIGTHSSQWQPCFSRHVQCSFR